MGSSKSRKTTFSNFNEDSPTHLYSFITRERLGWFQWYTYHSSAFWKLFHMTSVKPLQLTFNSEILLLRKKQLNSLQNCYKIHFLTYRVERLFNQEFCCLRTWREVDAQLNWSVAENCLMVLQLTSHLHDVNSANKSSRIKHYVYSESDKTLDKLAVI